MKKVYKTIKQDNGTMTFYGSNNWIKCDYGSPEWELDKAKEENREPYPEMKFRYHGRVYYISEFMVIDKYMPDWFKEFDGYLNESFFSGIAIKVNVEENLVKAFTFIG